MVHQSPFAVRTVHSHGVQGKHLLVNGWHGPIALQIQEETQFHCWMCLEMRHRKNPIEVGLQNQEQIQVQSFQQLSYIVVQMNGWENPNEVDGHMRYPENMCHSNC